MRTNFKIVVALFIVIQSLSYLTIEARLQGHAGKVYPFCDDISSPSIPCDSNDGNRPDPTNPCSNIFFICASGVSYCFNCQSHEPIEIFYDVVTNQCLPPEQVPGCNGCVNGVCPTNQPPAESTTQGGGCPSQTCGNPTTDSTPNPTTTTTTTPTTTTSPTTTTTPTTTTSPTTTTQTVTVPPTGPTCLSFEEHLKHLQ